MFFLTIAAESWDGGDGNGTRGKGQLTSSSGAPWALCASEPSCWEAPCGSYTAALGRVRRGRTLSLSREATGH